MLRISGNSIGAVIPVIPVTLYLVSDVNTIIKFMDTSNNLVENQKLQTLVMNDIQSSGVVTELGTSKRYYVNGITFAVDFTKFT